LNDEAPSIFLEQASRLPEFKTEPFDMLLRMKSTDQSPVHHPEGNVWNHTLLVVNEAAKRKLESADPEVFLWAALLHDIGKPATTKIRKGKITAYDHDKVGAELAGEFLACFTDDREFIQKVTSLIRYHMLILYVAKGLPFGDVGEMKRHTSVKEVALLGLCDRLGRTGVKREAEEEQVELFVEQCGGEDRKGTTEWQKPE
jgi:putative nucleotidyltransferase with HDIG domain